MIDTKSSKVVNLSEYRQEKFGVDREYYLSMDKESFLKVYEDTLLDIKGTIYYLINLEIILDTPKELIKEDFNYINKCILSREINLKKYMLLEEKFLVLNEIKTNRDW